MRKSLFLPSILFPALITLLSGCGSSNSSSDGLGNKLTGLQSLPSVSGMVTTNSSSSASLQLDIDGMGFRGVGLQTLSGTPETIAELGASSTLLDTRVFGGLVSTIRTANSATSTQAQDFWKGQGRCMLMQSVGESLGRMLEQGTSMCYMREIPRQTGAMTVVSGDLADPTTVFDQQNADRLVKVQIADSEYGSQNIFIRVHGKSNLASADDFQITMYECNPDTNAIQGYEVLAANKSTGVFTGTGYHSGDWGSGIQTISAFLTVNAAGNVVFDPSKDRSANSHWTGNWGTFKGSVTITGDNLMYGKRYNTSIYNSTTNIDKNYAVTSFSGTSMATLRFLEGAFSGVSSWGGESHSYSGATEYQNTVYGDVSSGSYLDTVNAYSFGSDPFFTSNLSVVASDTSGYSCSATADIVVSINMQSSAMQTIQATCEADRFSNYSMCWSNAIQEAQSIVFSSQSY